MLRDDADIIKQCIKDKDYDKLAALSLSERLDISKAIIDMFPKLFERKITRIGAGGIAKEMIERDYRLSLPGIVEKLKENYRSLDL